MELSLPSSELPHDVVNYDDSLRASTNEPEEDWGAEVAKPTNFYQLKLSLEHIHMVDTESTYQDAIEKLTKVSACTQ